MVMSLAILPNGRVASPGMWQESDSVPQLPVKGVDGQRKCPLKWPAKMSLELLAMVSGHSVLTVGRFIGGLSACMYFFAVSRWMASSRATLRIDRPLRFAFCTSFHLAV